MKTIRCESPESLIDQSRQWLSESIQVHDIKSIYLPAGASPQGLYQSLSRQSLPGFDKLKLVQIDDVISGEKAWIFKAFLNDNLLPFQAQLHTIDQKRMQADAVILGLGLNGHVAFHEPQLPPDFAYGELTLSRETCQHLGLAPGTRGVSYGLASFLKCRRILLMVHGQHKRGILSRVLAADPSLPATQVLGHPDCTLIADDSALSR